jgi:hypothetical protein
VQAGGVQAGGAERAKYSPIGPTEDHFVENFARFRAKNSLMCGQ